MHFSDETKKLLSCFIDEFEMYMNEPINVNKTRLDQILLSLYYDIIASHNFIDYIYKNINLKINKYPPLKEDSLFSAYYMPPSITKEIKDHEKGSISYTCHMKSHKIKIYFIIFDENEYEQLPKYEKYVKKMLTWLNMGFLCTSCSCSKNLSIYIYPTNQKKKLPLRIITALGPKNCNSAVTTGCVEDSSIIIFRKEEWFKVFIHETFHALGLDFVNISLDKFNSQIKSIFPLKIPDLRLYEAYTEFWATIMNCLFGAFYLLDDDKNKLKKQTDFLVYSYFLFQIEQFFSLFQCVKVLKFMGLRYELLYKMDNTSVQCRNSLYKEKNTHVFSYYILKCLFMFYYYDFLDWCRVSNCNTFGFLKTPYNLESLFQFIKKRYKNDYFLEKLARMRLFIIKNRIKKEEGCVELFKTTRMTICEWDSV